MFWNTDFQLVYAICKKLDSQEDIYNFLEGCQSSKYMSNDILKAYYNSLVYKVKVNNLVVKIKQFKFQNLKKYPKIAVIGSITNNLKQHLFKKFFKEPPLIFNNLNYWNFQTKSPIVWENPIDCIADFEKLGKILNQNKAICVIENPSVWYFAIHYNYLKHFDYVFVFNLGDPPIDKLHPDKNKILSPLSGLLNIEYSNFLLRSVILNESLCAVIDKSTKDLAFLKY